ncbi:hypothetical protein STEG23_026701 [Scotinomys teguina]
MYLPIVICSKERLSRVLLERLSFLENGLHFRNWNDRTRMTEFQRQSASETQHRWNGALGMAVLGPARASPELPPMAVVQEVPGQTSKLSE